LVRRLVEMHAGTVTAVSAGPGMGSEFVVRLPALPTAPTAPASVAEQPLSEITPVKLGILVIDDNRDLAEGLALFLRNAGHRVRVAHDGETGMACAAEENPDVVLLDLGLPGIDGYTIAERMRATDALQNTTIVAVSGYPPVSDERTRRARFDAHVVKPIAYDRLLNLLQEKSTTGRVHLTDSPRRATRNP
jgi:CheY-like chemotaxis protein